MEGRGWDHPGESHPWAGAMMHHAGRNLRRERPPRSPPSQGQLSTKKTDREAQGGSCQASAWGKGPVGWDVTWGWPPPLEGWAPPTARCRDMVDGKCRPWDPRHQGPAQYQAWRCMQKVPCSHSLSGKMLSWLPHPFFSPLSALQQQTVTATSGQTAPKMHAM